MGLSLGLNATSSSYSSFTLTDISSLSLWLQNNKSVTAAKWDDSSGFDNHATQSDEANQAAVSGGGLDFERDNSDHYDLTTKIDIADNQGFCVAIVVTRESETAGGLLSDGSTEMIQFENATTLRMKTVNSSATATTTDAVFPAGTFATGSKFILLVNRSAGASNRFTFFKNGAALTADPDTSSNEAAGENPGGIEFTVLGSRDGSANFFDGIIHEVAVWSRSLTAQEITDVNSYLQEIHGL
jgi:hypothetical protein